MRYANSMRRPAATVEAISAKWSFSRVPARAAIQAKLSVGAVDDPLEHEADRVADQVMGAPRGPIAVSSAAAGSLRRKCAACDLADRDGGQHHLVADVLRSPGRPIDAEAQAFFARRFAHDFSTVRIHADSDAARSVAALGAKAYTVGSNIAFGAGQYQPSTDSGRLLLAHELAHAVQQGAAPRKGAASAPAAKTVGTIQRQPAPSTTGARQSLTLPLTKNEWARVYGWLTSGNIGTSPVTSDPDRNAELVASEIFCDRLSHADPDFSKHGDPLLCVVPSVTASDPRVVELKGKITEGGLILPTPAVPLAVDAQKKDQGFDRVAAGPVSFGSLPDKLSLPEALNRELDTMEAATQKSGAEEGLELLRSETPKTGGAYREMRAPSGPSTGQRLVHMPNVAPRAAATGETLAVSAHTHPPPWNFVYPSLGLVYQDKTVGDVEDFVRHPVNVFLVRSKDQTSALVRTAEFAAWVDKVGIEEAVKQIEEDRSDKPGKGARVEHVAAAHKIGVYLGDNGKPLKRR